MYQLAGRSRRPPMRRYHWSFTFVPFQLKITIRQVLSKIASDIVKSPDRSTITIHVPTDRNKISSMQHLICVEQQRNRTTLNRCTRRFRPMFMASPCQAMPMAIPGNVIDVPTANRPFVRLDQAWQKQTDWIRVQRSNGLIQKMQPWTRHAQP